MLNVNGPVGGGNDTAVSHVKHRVLPDQIATVLTGLARLVLPLKSPVSATTTVCLFSWLSADSIFRRLSGDSLDMLSRDWSPFIHRKHVRAGGLDRVRERERESGRVDGNEQTGRRWVLCWILDATESGAALRVMHSQLLLFLWYYKMLLTDLYLVHFLLDTIRFDSYYVISFFFILFLQKR